MDEVIAAWRSAGYLPKSGRLNQATRLDGRRRILAVFIMVLLVVVLFNSISPRIIIHGKRLTNANVLVADITGGPGGFPESVFNILGAARLSWVLYESLSVDSLRAMPSGGYRLVVLKAHSGPNMLATSESYSLFGHAFEQITDRVGRFRVEGKDYFSILPEFVRTMEGRFDGTMILLMGCNTLTGSDLARAFLEKGASIVVGWKGLISSGEADLATLLFLEEVFMERKATSSAVSDTMNLLGAYLGPGDELTFYSA